MGTMKVDDTTVDYSLIRNATYGSKANPHKLIASCACGVQFVELAASSVDAERYRPFIVQMFKRHQSMGACKLVATCKHLEWRHVSDYGGRHGYECTSCRAFEWRGK